MSGDGSKILNWPDGERKFRFGIGELRELQDKCDAGPAKIARDLGNGDWRIDYVREVLRIGLIGGGLDSQKALGLIGRYLVPTKYMECAGIAAVALFHALVGDVDDSENLGKAKAETTTDGSASRPSTEAEPLSDGRREKSTNVRSLNSPPP